LEAISGDVERTNTELTEQKSDFHERTKKKYEVINAEDPWLEQLDVKGIYENIGRLELRLTSLKEKKKTLDEDYEELNKKIENLTEEIDSNNAKGQLLIQTFEKKYSRFIQEASWISEDYKDNELYYIDAESTLHKAS
jgi:predicted nuclease with TOPRIM domain